MLLIGENLNVINTIIGKAFMEKDPGPIAEEAKRQKEKGMDWIDINLGPARKGGGELMEFVVKTVQEEKANRAMLVPTMLKRVIDDPDFAKYDLSSIKVITYGAAPMPFEVIKKAIDVFPGVMFINAFGQTETASTITTLGPEDHVITGTDEEKAKKLKRLQSSIGRPMEDVEVN